MRKLIYLLLGLLFTANISAQTVKGVVKSSSDGEPLIGAAVLIKGTTIGTVADVNGAFVIQTTGPNDVLVVSFLGYVTKEVPVGNSVDFSIVLDEDHRTMNEVVVIGYGVQKKSLVSGSISKVTAEEISRTMPTRLEDMLSGKVTGMQIMQQNGQPGAGFDVYVRGAGTVNNANPLFIVDGMQIAGNINFLNPKDIASVEVLKDAASLAIYGTRGANGVIIITTKEGEKGKRNISYEFNYGWQNPWKKREVLNSQEYMTLMNEMSINDGGVIRYTPEEIRNAKTTDWQDAVFNYNAPVINHNVSMTGGSDNNSYAFSFGYLKQDGIIGGNYGKSNLERYNFRINDTQTAFETNSRTFLNKIKAGVNFAYTHGENTSIDANSEWGSVLGSAVGFAPNLPVYEADPEAALAAHPYAIKDKDGRVYTVVPAGYQEIGNPVAMLANENQYRLNKEDVFVGGVWTELNIWKGITLRSSYNIDMAFWGNNGYNMPYYIASQGKYIDDSEHSNIFAEKNNRFTWQVENYISWTEQFAGLHNITVMAGQSALKTTVGQIGGSRGMPNYDEHDLLLDLNNTPANPLYYNVYGYYNGNGVNFYSLASYFGRINYNFDERYILSASIRRDGSSRFGPDRKWGMFPAVSVAWNILNEPYISNKPDWMNSAKLRASWGVNGNDNFEDLRYMTIYQRGGAYDYYFGGGYDPATNSWSGTLVPGVQIGGLENRMLAWEESEQINLGLDLGLLRNAFTFSFDWFKKTTKGMIQRAFIPGSTGQNPPYGNVGDMSNKGIELAAGYKGKVGSFNYFIDANATYIKTVLDKYASADGIQYNIESNGAGGLGEFMRGATGEVYPFFYGLKTDGIFQTQDEIDNYIWKGTETVWDNDLAQEVTKEVTKVIQPNAKPGDLRFIDMDNNGSITDEDKTNIGKPMPDWMLGFTLGGDWKGFDINFFFKGATGFQIYDFSQRTDISQLNRPAWVLERWHGEGTSNTVPRMTALDRNGNIRSSDLYLKDGSYLRLKSVQLGYTLPKDLTEKIAIQKFRVFVAAYNLLTFTGYDGYDVEIGNHSVDRGVYPQARTIAVGANIIF